jgi:HK97 family phage prohead protease
MSASIRLLAAPEVKLLAEAPRDLTPEGTFEGYASLFGVADLGRDIVMPGAFTGSLARRGAGGIRMLWQHDPAEPLGRWLSLTEDHRGLHVRGQLNLAVRRAREVAAMMKDGSVDGLSIGFRVVEARPERGLRRLVKVDLWEISIVTFPMLPGARVGAVKRHAAPDAGAPATLPPERRLALAIRRATARLRHTPSLRQTPSQPKRIR